MTASSAFPVAFTPLTLRFVTDPKASPPALVLRVDATTGVQAVVSSGGSLSTPTGVAVEMDGNYVVADTSSIIRVDSGTGVSFAK